jgi:hypothetical protein
MHASHKNHMNTIHFDLTTSQEYISQSQSHKNTFVDSVDLVIELNSIPNILFGCR